MMDFDQSRSYLSQALTFGIRLGLERMEDLMELLGHPERNMNVIHIAGTNGKGSVTTYCASMLAAQNYRVGVYTSPYLERFTERIRVLDGATALEHLSVDETTGEISRQDFAAIMSRVKNAVDQMLAQGAEHPTEFELITACAFLYFQQQACDWIVLETGLGGRLDSTNIIADPKRVIITALGYDHMDRLGHTLAQIALEKAGIIKAACPVWLYDPLAAVKSNDPNMTKEAWSARAVIENRSIELRAPLTLLAADECQTIKYTIDGQTFTFKGQQYTTQLLGPFQPMNASLAISACQGIVSKKNMARGIAAARWPARLEIFPQTPHRPLTLLDGAHNPQGCLALGEALERLMPEQPIVFIVGLLEDKDYAGMLKGLFLNHSYTPAAIICVTPDNPRALPAQSLAKVLSDLKIVPSSGYNGRGMIHVSGSPSDGLSLAIHLAQAARAPLCAFGSLYLAGQLRAWIKGSDLP